MGFTQHLRGVEATEELVALCHIGAGKYVLDVGCGAGATPAYLARRYGCRVVGVDISRRMIDRAQETAMREGMTDGTEFRVADAQDLVVRIYHTVSHGHPALTVAATMPFSGTTSGLLHDLSMNSFLMTGLLYGVPVPVAFTSRGWERAVSARYIVNMVSWVGGLLGDLMQPRVSLSSWATGHKAGRGGREN